jgi:HEXXH motif-containing protein
MALALSAIRDQPVPPIAFAIYHELVTACFDNDTAAVDANLERFASCVLQGASVSKFTTLRDEDLGNGGVKLLRKMINQDCGLELPLQALDPGAAIASSQLAEAAIDLIRKAEPQMAAEIDVLARQIVFVRSSASDVSFGGATTFFLWGAVIINPAAEESRIGLAETLAHESAHALLFGLSGARPLTTNPADETCASPLRADPRPVEGVVHATYVLGRMIYLLRSILALGSLNQAEIDEVRERLQQNTRFFDQGLGTVRDHAKFTDVGREIFEACLQCQKAEA